LAYEFYQYFSARRYLANGWFYLMKAPELLIKNTALLLVDSHPLAETVFIPRFNVAI